MLPQLIDNKNNTLRDDLAATIKDGSKVSIAAACFSIYAYQELKMQLQRVDRLRFIFTSPTFTTEKAPKAKREFYIPRLNRERSLYGTEFEVKLRNELTQKAIAKECADWIRSKVDFKSNVTTENMMGFINVDDKNYTPINGFTTVDLGCERGNNAYSMIQKNDSPFSQAYIDLFEQLWNDKTRLQSVTEEVIESITAAYNENSPDFIYFVTLYNIFNEFLEDISEDFLPNEATGFKESKIWGMLFNFQRDAALAIINKLERFNGCILADSVGLGKTFTALAVVKYYENRNKSVLVLCPKKLMNNWNTYKDNYVNNPIASDRLRYDVLFHTDLSRTYGSSNGLDLSRLNWSNYDLVVIDESHSFRNGGRIDEGNEKENRYTRLLKNVIRKGVKTKVLMLSATPVNNRFNDLKNQLALAYEGNTELIDDKLDTSRSIDDIFRAAQRAFNTWSNWEPQDRTTSNLQKMLDFDFFEVLDSVTIARSRKHIENYYDTTDIGKFPERKKPISLRPHLTDLESAINYNEIFTELMRLSLSIYTPTHYILPSRMSKYEEIFEDNKVNTGFTQAAREQGIRRLTAINLMKRMESSVYAFSLTLGRIMELIGNTIKTIDNFDRQSGVKLELNDITNLEDYDDEDENSDLFSIGKKVKIDLADMDYKSWRDSLAKDKEVLDLLSLMVSDITPEHDSKLQALFGVLRGKIERPINAGNKKIIIFTAFADTAEYLYDNVSEYMNHNFGLDTAMVTGSIEGRSTIKKLHCDLNTVLTCFSPISKDKQLLMPNNSAEIDVLIATDCISEGQNLQDCDYLINYDIHWNPVRIIQRFGRIDRIGSKNACIQLVNFWPDLDLDEYINLKAKVETRMKIVDMTATGDDNIISDEEKTDLEYRKAQLKRLQDEVVDIEDMSSGISIMDLGLNEFRLDLLEYIKENPDLDKTPFGMHAVVGSSADTPPGVVFVLKNLNGGVNIGNQNRLHPFYMVYISDDGDVVCDHLSPKDMLDKMRYLCRGKKEAIPELYRAFNKETKDGRNMSALSQLLGQAIASIIEVKSESELDSFLSGGQVSFAGNKISGLDDFELICFLVVRPAKSQDAVGGGGTAD
jgi:SNF2 family DNA or RNA helicase